MKLVVPSNLQFSKLKLKELPMELKYIFLGEGRTFPIIISSTLNELQEGKLKKLLVQHRGVMRWTIANLKEISSSICTYRIFL